MPVAARINNTQGKNLSSIILKEAFLSYWSFRENCYSVWGVSKFSSYSDLKRKWDFFFTPGFQCVDNIQCTPWCHAGFCCCFRIPDHSWWSNEIRKLYIQHYMYNVFKKIILLISYSFKNFNRHIPQCGSFCVFILFWCLLIF